MSRVAAAAGGCILLDTQVLRTWIGLSNAARSYSWLTDVEADLENGGSYKLTRN